MQSGSAVKVEALNIFDGVVDEFMTVFYNALVGSKIKAAIIKEINSKILSPKEISSDTEGPILNTKK